MATDMNPQINERVRGPTHAAPNNFVRLVGVTLQKAAPSLDTIPLGGNLLARTTRLSVVTDARGELDPTFFLIQSSLGCIQLDMERHLEKSSLEDTVNLLEMARQH